MTMMTKFCPLLTTYLSTPCFVNVVKKQPLSIYIGWGTKTFLFCFGFSFQEKNRKSRNKNKKVLVPPKPYALSFGKSTIF